MGLRHFDLVTFPNTPFPALRGPIYSILARYRSRANGNTLGVYRLKVSKRAATVPFRRVGTARITLALPAQINGQIVGKKAGATIITH